MAGESLHVFVALEGGGAKGLVHIGALKALEERSVTFRGLAGTSAGAIVAALKAAGYSADDMVDPVRKTTLLPQIDERFHNATDFFGRSAWARIRLFRTFVAHLGRKRTKYWLLVLAAVFLASVGTTAGVWGAFGAMLAVSAWVLIFVLLYFVIIGGLATVRDFRNTLSRTLQRKMFPDDEAREVKFSDFGVGDVPSLKIVATNLTQGELRLFSPEETPEIAVADAVAASICLPVVFRAWDIDGSLHFDGGLVSNLPAWTFDEERELDPDAMTIAIEIRGPLTDEAPPTTRHWLLRAIRTAIFGSSVLNKRVTGRFELVPLNTDLELLAFDANGDKVFEVVNDATVAARVAIVQRLFVLPQIYHDACAAVHDLVHGVLANDSVLLGGETFKGRIRVARAAPADGHHRSLQLDYGFGYDTDADTDEELLLPVAGTYVGEAYSSNDVTFAYFRVPGTSQSTTGAGSPGNGLDRQRRRLVWRDMAWLFCIPVVLDGAARPTFVVTVDCSQPIDPNAENLADVLDLLSSEIVTIFKKAATNLREGSDVDQDQGT